MKQKITHDELKCPPLIDIFKFIKSTGLLFIIAISNTFATNPHSYEYSASLSFTNIISGDIVNDFSDIQMNITGKVTDINGQPIPGVNIIAKGTKIGTQTDFDGNYSISISNNSTVLVFSYVGLITQEVSINGNKVVNVVMDEDITTLDAVVVVGYGSVKRSDLTGSVASVTAEDIQETPNSNVVSLLQGRASGVQVSTGDGQPGGGMNIRIRGTSTITGSTEPLYIIDGFPVTSSNDALNVGGGIFEGNVEGTSNDRVKPNALQLINPNDIANIEILKDAAATAIYGSRGANGVVLITTKRGKEGKPKMEVNYSVGVQSIIKKINRRNGPDAIRNLTEREINDGILPADVRYNGSDEFHPLAENAQTYDWQDIIYRQAIVQDIALSFTGGTENTKYLISGKFLDQEGIMVDNRVKNAQFRINLDQNVGKLLTFKTNVALNRIVSDNVPAGAAFNYNTVTSTLGEFPANNPEWKYPLDESRWYIDPKLGNEQYTNPLKILQDTDDITKTNRMLANVQADLHLTKSLTLTGSYGIDYADITRDIYLKRTLTFASSAVNGGEAQINNRESIRTNYNAYLTWVNTFGEHDLNLVAGAERTTQIYTDLNVSSSQFANDDLGTGSLSTGTQSTFKINNGKSRGDQIGFFGRLNYSYQGKYLVSLNARQDGSSVFGPNNKWGFFPSAALGWKISDEAFLKDNDILSNLKLRASIGQTGNGNLDFYSSAGLWSIQSNRYSFGGVPINGVNLSRIDNPNLKWETTTQYNIGFDARFLKGRFGLTVDYFVKDTKDLILDITIPQTSGFRSSRQNVGALKNTGFEFGLDGTIINSDTFQWDANANLTFIKNEATNIGEFGNTDPNTGELYLEVNNWPRRGGTRLYTNRPAGEIYGYVIEGVFDTQEQANNWPVDMNSGRTLNQEGYWIYKDINNDGVITDADQTSLGNGTPDLVFGLTNRFKYKNFDLSMFFEGQVGNEIYMFYGGDYDKPQNSDNWTPTNRDAQVAINKSVNGRKGLVFDNLGIQDGSYLRLKNVRLGYSFPKDYGLFGGINLFVTATNLLTLTTYDGYDPSVSSGGGSAFGEGFDTGVYPTSRQFTLGVNLKF